MLQQHKKHMKATFAHSSTVAVPSQMEVSMGFFSRLFQPRADGQPVTDDWSSLPDSQASELVLMDEEAVRLMAEFDIDSAIASHERWLPWLSQALQGAHDERLRPEVVRYARRIDRVSLEGEVLITDDSHMDASGFDRVLYWKPPFGPFPAELAETYPFNAEVPEEADSTALRQAERILQELIGSNPEARFSIRLKQKQQSI